MSGVEMSGVELSGVEMSTFGIKIGHFNPRLYNRIYCVIPVVEMSGIEMSPTQCRKYPFNNFNEFLVISSRRTRAHYAH